MSKTLSKQLSQERFNELLRLSKLKVLTEDEAVLDTKYLENMIALAAKIDVISTDHLEPATHAFDLEQRLRSDDALSTSHLLSAYQILAPSMHNALFCVPTVIE